MNRFLISEYVKRLKKDDIYNYGLKENIILEDYEVDVIYDYVKKYYIDVLDGDGLRVLDSARNKIKINTYNKIVELYYRYKDMI